MDRRELLLGAVTLAVATAAGRAIAHDDHEEMKDDSAESHQHHHDRKSLRNEKLISAATDCVTKANVCLQHCLVSLGEGDSELGECARSSSEVIALCSALLCLAAAESRNLPALARVAMDVCKHCEKECEKTDKHPECKACGEACAACYKECKAIAA
ncbi:MAG: four-helix bundle copper-binding protein [Gammaproteobacteria bacterium]|nr:four-helix bundle copper-binding protein [Gammaproteobacteria bacterium]